MKIRYSFLLDLLLRRIIILSIGIRTEPIVIDR